MIQLTQPKREVELEPSRHRATPAVIGSVVVVTLIAKLVSSFINHRLRRHDVPLRTVEHAVLGYGGDRVLRRLGTPSAVTQNPSNVWYYRLSSRDRHVMAVTFEKGRAARVEMIRSPA